MTSKSPPRNWTTPLAVFSSLYVFTVFWFEHFHFTVIASWNFTNLCSCFANVTEVHHWNNHTNLWMLLIQSFFNSIAGKHQSQSNYGFLLLRFVAEMCKSLKYPPTIWNAKAPCITIVVRLICTLFFSGWQKHLRFSRVATWKKAGFHKVNQKKMGAMP